MARTTVVVGSQTYSMAATSLLARAYTLTDEGLTFQPIHRVLTSCRNSKMLADSRGHESHGAWTTFTSESMTERALLDLRIKKTVRSATRAFCGLMLLLDPSAPLINVVVRTTPSGNHAALPELCAFHGRAFIIDVDQARALGMVISRGDQTTYYDPEEVAEEFAVEVIETGRDTRPNIVTAANGEAVILPSRAKRRINLSRRDE